MEEKTVYSPQGSPLGSPKTDSSKSSSPRTDSPRTNLSKSSSPRTDSARTKIKSGTLRYKSDVLDFTTLQLLSTAQANHGNQVKKISEFSAAMNSQKTQLHKNALTPQNLSLLSAAYCISLYQENVSAYLDKLYAAHQNAEDFSLFERAYLEIKRDLEGVFTYWPLGAEVDLTPRYAEILYSHAEKSENSVCKLLIAARLEVFGYKDYSVVIYAYLLTTNFSPLAQISNLIRIGVGSPEALFQISQQIISMNFSDEKFQGPLFFYTKMAIQQLELTRSPADVKQNFLDFNTSRKPAWVSIGLRCIELAIYNKKAPHAHAACYFSTLLMSGIKNHLIPNPEKACAILDYVFKHNLMNFKYIPKEAHSPQDKIKLENSILLIIQQRNNRALLLKQLKEFHRKNNDDLWINAILAKFYTLCLNQDLSISENNLLAVVQKSNIKLLEESQEAYEHFQRVYSGISSNNNSPCAQETALISSLRQYSYVLAESMLALHDSYRNDEHIAPPLLLRSEHLLTQSAHLGYYYSHYRLAILKQTRVTTPLSGAAAQEIDNHFRCALEDSMANLNKNEYEIILAHYQAFITLHKLQPTHQRLFDKFKLRLDDMRLNLEALVQFDKARNAPARGILFSSNERKLALTQLDFLSARSPLAAAILWHLNGMLGKQSRCESFITTLDFRGLLFNLDSNDFKNIITIFTDYFILTKKDPHAKVFFTCLESGLKKSPQILQINQALRTQLQTLKDFYTAIIDDDFEACRKCIRTSYDTCSSAFSMLNERLLLPPKTYNHLRELFNPIAAAPVAFAENAPEESYQHRPRLPQDDPSFPAEINSQIYLFEAPSPAAKIQATRTVAKHMKQANRTSPRDDFDDLISDEIISDEIEFSCSAPTDHTPPPIAVAKVATPGKTLPEDKRRFSDPEIPKKTRSSAPVLSLTQKKPSTAKDTAPPADVSTSSFQIN
jgi:hypothetical protein